MKVVILKSHENYRANEEVDVDEGTAKYWIYVGVAVDADSVDKPEEKEAIEEKLIKKLNVNKAPVAKKIKSAKKKR